MARERDRFDQIINEYIPVKDFCQFAFRWNKKNGEELRDKNL